MARNRVIAAAATTLILPLLSVTVSTSTAAAAPAAPVAAPTPTGSDMRELTKKDFTLDGKKLDLPSTFQASASTKSARVKAAPATPAVGTVRQWLGLDDVAGNYYRKDYTLRGVGDKIEVWVANDIAFPANDCRSQIPSSTQITDAQVADLINEFDTNMYPKETAAFSTPPDRDGTHPRLPPDPATGVVGDYTGDGDKTVTLIDNVRDANYYDFATNPTYIAGFFWSTFNEAFDRNVMTIDAFDWLHRTGANPPDEPTNDPCTSRGARPRAYEATFAHEWQHLLHYYTDPNEVTWVNEGLSDFAQTLVGYVDANNTVFDPRPDSHIYCYQGFGPVVTASHPSPLDCGGPQNSLTLWDEGTPSAVLADYGNAYQFMLFLFDRYGLDFMSKLHRDGTAQGIAGLREALAAEGVTNVYKVIHDYQTATLVDKIVGDRFGLMLGVPKSRVTAKTFRSTVNLANPQAYEAAGAAPNGADFVPLQAANGTVLRGRDLRSVRFNGATTLPPAPMEWTLTSEDPDRAGNSVLFSGNASGTNVTAVIPVDVPTADPTLTFLAKYGAEAGYDYGYVSVSTDGGKTYTAIAGDKTVETPNGPALNGTTTGFEPHTFDLSAYAGTSILVNFQYISDGGIDEGGLLIDDIAVGGILISDGSSLEPFRTASQISPTVVNNWNLRLIGIDEKRHAAWQFEYNGRASVNVNRWDVALLSIFPKVVAVVAYDEPTEQVTQYAPYTLTVNGVVQPGGGPAAALN
jgi:hypothetical protein